MENRRKPKYRYNGAARPNAEKELDKLKKYLHERVKRPQSEEYDTEEIEQITDVYAEFVISIIEQMKENGCEPLAFVEERVDYSHIAPSGFGTADMLTFRLHCAGRENRRSVHKFRRSDNRHAGVYQGKRHASAEC